MILKELCSLFCTVNALNSPFNTNCLLIYSSRILTIIFVTRLLSTLFSRWKLGDLSSWSNVFDWVGFES